MTLIHFLNFLSPSLIVALWRTCWRHWWRVADCEFINFISSDVELIMKSLSEYTGIYLYVVCMLLSMQIFSWVSHAGNVGWVAPTTVPIRCDYAESHQLFWAVPPHHHASRAASQRLQVTVFYSLLCRRALVPWFLSGASSPRGSFMIRSRIAGERKTLPNANNKIYKGNCG